MIAAHLSIRYAGRIRSLIMLSAPVFPLNPGQLIRTLFQWDKIRGYMRNMFVVPPQATRQFYRLVDETMDIYHSITVPVLIVQSLTDHLVRANSGQYLYEQLPGADKKLLLVRNSGHLVCHGQDCDEIFKEVHVWIDQHTHLPAGIYSDSTANIN